MTKINVKKSIVLLACCLGFSAIHAQYSQEAKIVSENREGRAEFGTSVAITENFAVVGASRENGASGAAYVYVKDNQGKWGFAQQLVATDPNNGAEYGGGVKFSEDYLVVAAGRADYDGLQRTGALYIYDYLNNNWEFDAKLIASDYSSDAKLGMNPTSLDVQANTIVAGAPGDDSWTGAVYVFTKVAGVWEETQKIMSPLPVAFDAFGIGVSTSGNYLAIGANAVDGRKGAVYIYIKTSNGVWEYDQTIMASDGVDDDFFGSSVSLAGEQMVVGAYGVEQEKGTAYVFEKNSDDVWVEVQKLKGNPFNDRVQYGWTTAIQKDYIAVTAPHIYGSEAGEVYLYKRENSGVWVENQIIQGADTQSEDAFGWSVGMYKDEIIIGSPTEDHDETGANEIGDAGSSYIFKNPSLLALTDFDAHNNVISMFPNPTETILNIESQAIALDYIRVYAITGALLNESRTINNSKLLLDTSNYNKGIYFIEVTLENGLKVTQKIIKN